MVREQFVPRADGIETGSGDGLRIRPFLLRRLSGFDLPVSCFLWLVVLAANVAFPGVAWAQGCAMCARNASALKSAALAALRSGILVLLVPAALLFFAIFALAFRKREPASADVEEDADLDLELNAMLASLPPATTESPRSRKNQECQNLVAEPSTAPHQPQAVAPDGDPACAPGPAPEQGRARG